MALDTEQIIREKLAPDEKLLWCGRPKQGWFLRSGDGRMLALGVIFTAFPLLLLSIVIANPENVKSPLAYVILPLFSLIGLYMSAGRFLIDSWLRRGIYYGLTEGRALFVSIIPTTSVEIVALWNVQEVKFSEYSDGTGDIQLGPDGPWNTVWYRGWHLPGMKESIPPMFERIENAKSVYEMIRKAQAGDR